ncbi:MAG: hypothetical protein Q9225_002061 [Loekoesia sp. 1 TL-2023]
MVATRSQDRDNHTPHTRDSETLVGRDTPVKSSGKRKASKSTVAATTPISSTKRRKPNGTPSKSEKDTPKILAAVVVPTPTYSTTTTQAEQPKGNDTSKHTREKGIDISFQGGHGRPVVGDHEANIGAGTMLHQRDERSRSHSPASHKKPTTNTQSTPASTKKVKPSPSSAKKSRRRDPRMEVTSIIDPSPGAPSVSSVLKATKSKHKRFGSEEAIPPAAIIFAPDNPPAESSDKRGTVEDSEAESSSDEAPEIVAQSTGLEKARSAVAEAAKAAEAQRATEKQKRRERDTLLKRQAEATRREVKQMKSKDIVPETPTDDDSKSQASPSPLYPPTGLKWSNEDPLPELLPEEILAAEPMVRFPTPLPEPLLAKALVNKKQRFLEEKVKPPNDVRKGNVKIRVLEERQAILPPKVSKSSRTIRESWLAGRLGAKGRVVMERRKLGGGFVRK